MARLGGWGAGLEAGFTGLIADQKARDEMAIRQKAADLAEKRFGLEQEQFNMTKDLHKAKMADIERDNRQIDVDEVGQTWGQKDPVAYNYGVDYATRAGLISTDPATGKRTIRGKDMQMVMQHMDTAPGVEQISKLKIADLEAKIPTIADPAERAKAEKMLEFERVNNKGALEWMKAQKAAEEKEKDRQTHIKVAQIHKAPVGETAGQSAYRQAATEKMKAETELIRNGGKMDDKTFGAYQKYIGSKEFNDAIALAPPEERETKARELVDNYLKNLDRYPRKKLGGAGGGQGYGNSQGFTYQDLMDSIQDAPSTSEAVRILNKKFGYGKDQAIEILKDSRKAGYLK